MKVEKFRVLVGPSVVPTLWDSTSVFQGSQGRSAPTERKWFRYCFLRGLFSCVSFSDKV